MSEISTWLLNKLKPPIKDIGVIQRNLPVIKQRIFDKVKPPIRDIKIIKKALPTRQTIMDKLSFVPKTGEAIGGIATEMWRLPQRAGVQVGLYLTDQEIYKPRTSMERAMLGEKDVRDVETTGMEYLKDFGFSEFTAQKYGLGTGVFFAVLDSLPFTSGKGKLGKDIIKIVWKEKAPTKIASILRKMGTAEDLIEPYSVKLAKTTDIKTVEKGFKELNRMMKETKVIKPVTKALTEVKGKDFTLIGVPRKVGLTPVVRIRREIEKSIKLSKEVAEKEKITIKKFEKELFNSIEKGVLNALQKERNVIRKAIGFQRHTKELGANVMPQLKQKAGIIEWKNASKEQLQGVLTDLKALEKKDSFLTEKQMKGLKDYFPIYEDPKFKIKDPFQKEFLTRLPRKALTGPITKRQAISAIKEATEEVKQFLPHFDTKIFPHIDISRHFFPTVDIKHGNKIIKNIVDKADFYRRAAKKNTEKIGKDLDGLMINAEKAGKGLGKKKREVNEKIFKAMGGEKIKLSTEEKEVVDFLNKYFEKARKELGLAKHRKNYITNIEKSFSEKLKSNKYDLLKTMRSFKNRDGEVPVDLMLALDNIVGSKKFFKFALERKGGLDVTTDIRKILHQYTQLAENKKALDKILPEGQVAIQLLLDGKSALWMKDFLQNLKGRGMDSKFRRGEMSWVAKSAESLIDYGYYRLLAGNLWSAAKNIAGGEANSLIFQSTKNYVTGKSRLVKHPKKACKIISESGIMDSSYTEILEAKSFSGQAKKVADFVGFGHMKAAEWEIRGSYFLGEMTVAEWKAGTVSATRFRSILDDIAITQGVFSKVDSPLFVQTTLGRATMQFGRWKITNLNLVRRLVKESKREIKAGVGMKGKNTQRLAKMFVIYAVGSYLEIELAKAGYKQLPKVAGASTELISLFKDLPGEVVGALTDNPLYSTLGSIAYTYENMASYMGIIEEPYPIEVRKGFFDQYWAGIKLLTGKKSLKEVAEGEEGDMDLDLELDIDLDIGLDLDLDLEL